MKKFLAFGVLITLLMLLLSACAQNSTMESFIFFYKSGEVTFGEDGLVGRETVQDISSDLSTVAARYFRGPQSEGLVSPFPKGTSLVRFWQEEDVLFMQLSEEFAGLSGADLSLAITCISMTFSQLDDVSSVEVSVENNLLNGKESIRLNGSRILLKDNSLAIAENTVNVYYADEQCRYLIAVEAKTKLETTAEQAAYAISLLGETPADAALQSTLPENTEILELSIEDGLCIIDFSGDFYRNRPESDAAERMTIFSIVNTLTEFPEIETVQFFVEGEALETYYHMDLSLIYVREEAAIGPVRPGLNETDASLYVVRKNDWMLTEVPMRVKTAANESEAEAVMAALLNYGEQNGFITPLPVGTEILSLTEEGNHCTLDLSQSFADGLTTEESELTAVQAIVSTLQSLDNIQTVTITVEGESDGLQYVSLNQTFN